MRMGLSMFIVVMGIGLLAMISCGDDEQSSGGNRNAFSAGSNGSAAIEANGTVSAQDEEPSSTGGSDEAAASGTGGLTVGGIPGSDVGQAGRSAQSGSGGSTTSPATDAETTAAPDGGAGISITPNGAAGTTATTDGEADSATTPETTCEKGVVRAEEVVFIGESFIAQTGAIPRYTSELARQAGKIGMTDSYRSYAVNATQLTTGWGAIPEQFVSAVREGPVKVVLMDGGGNDLLAGGRCQNGFDPSCNEIVTTVDALFAQMKTEGVTDVVYFFYPDPMGIGARIKDAMDILRPEMKRQCEEETDLRCVWVDQRESWEGNYETYTLDGIHPTDAGARASAQQIWEAMVANCIAQ